MKVFLSFTYVDLWDVDERVHSDVYDWSKSNTFAPMRALIAAEITGEIYLAKSEIFLYAWR